MMPFMAQGAAMSIEDAVVFARSVDAFRDDLEQALKCFEATRLHRTSRIQIGSRGNAWLKSSADADWVYAYDAWSVDLA